MGTTTVKGFERFGENLKKLGKEMAGEIMREAMMAGAEVLRAEIERNAPVGTGPKRPKRVRLSQNIVIYDSHDKTELFQSNLDQDIRFLIGPSKRAFHGFFEEVGTSTQPARPFIRPAFDSKAEEALRTVEAKLAEGFEQKAGK
jgi:HK97 gp10 family phage protein